MTCVSTCLLVLMLISASLYVSLTTGREIGNFEKTLDAEQAKLYSQIVKYRHRLYLKGLFIGLALALSYYVLRVNTDSKEHMSLLCDSMFIMIFFAQVFYILSPKGAYMVNHLQTPEQKREWLAVYRSMQVRHTVGFLIPLMALGLRAILQ